MVCRCQVIPIFLKAQACGSLLPQKLPAPTQSGCVIFRGNGAMMCQLGRMRPIVITIL